MRHVAGYLNSEALCRALPRGSGERRVIRSQIWCVLYAKTRPQSARYIRTVNSLLVLGKRQRALATFGPRWSTRAPRSVERRPRRPS